MKKRKEAADKGSLGVNKFLSVLQVHDFAGLRCAIS